MKNLFIIKRILQDKTLSDEAFTVWCGLRNIMQKDKKEYFVSFNMIAHSVFNRVPIRSEKEAIKRGYKELVERKYIVEIEEYSKSEHVVDLSAVYYEGGEFFADLTMEEMHKIMNLDCDKDKYKLLRYFTCQVGSFNKSKDMNYYNGKIGGMSLDCFTELIPITKDSVIEYNKILEENKLLFAVRHADFFKYYTGKGDVREIPNTYSRWEDREQAKHYAQNTHGYKYFTEQVNGKTSDANKRRGLGQKLRYFMQGKEYDLETIKELYAYAEDRNAKMQDDYNRGIKNGYDIDKPCYYDMSIFDNYLKGEQNGEY